MIVNQSSEGEVDRDILAAVLDLKAQIRTIERKMSGLKSQIETSGGNYRCNIGKNKRTITNTRSGTNCVSRYTREDGSTQIIWRTPSHPEACVAKSADFVKPLRSIGVTCKPG